MGDVAEEICTYEEVYGFLQELEERVLFMKYNDYLWGGDDPGERVRNNLYAIALLSSLNGNLDKNYITFLERFTSEAETRYISDRQYLLPYILGLYVTYKYIKNKKAYVVKKLMDILLKAEIETNRLSFGVEYLFSISFFIDLLESNIEDEVLQQVISKANQIAANFSENYVTIYDNETKVKLLYSLAALPKTKENLIKLNESFKADIEDLNKRVKAEDFKALLIRPYMLLGVQCNRKIVFNLMKYFRENRYSYEGRKILQKLSHFFIYMDAVKNSDIEIKKLVSNQYKISFNFSEENLLSLQKQMPGIPFTCKIALALCNAGFKRIYTIPGHERKEYLEFIKSKETEKYIRIYKKGKEELLEEATDFNYQIMIAKGSILLIVSIVISIISIILSQPPLYSAVPIVIFFVSQLSALTPKVSESGYALINTIIKKKHHKKRIHQRLEKMLE